MLTIFISLALAHSSVAIPPELSPPRETLEIAAELWRLRPVAAEDMSSALEFAASGVAQERLFRHGEHINSRWSRRFAALRARILERAGANRPYIEARVTHCLAAGLAWALPVDDLADLRAFVATDSGGRFWEVYSRATVRNCYQVALSEFARPFFEEDERATRGLR